MAGDPVARLLALEKLGVKFGLEAIQTLAAALGDPQLAYPTVIVAGTNGKGSVTAFVDTALRAAGFRSGRYTSPHLVRLEERFVIDGREVEPAALRAAAAVVLDLVDRLVAASRLHHPPTFFEAATAIAFELFRRAAVEIAVVEVGLGGRLDATNIAAPLAAAITTVDFDHERFLGSTLVEIAREKAGVIKAGMDVVVGEKRPELVALFAQVCEQRGARLLRADEGLQCDVRRGDGRGCEITLRTPAGCYGPLVLALGGRHQVDNAVTAVRLLEALGRHGLSVPAAAIEHALTHTSWPGRLDLVRVAPDREVLFDAAHNPAGARALADFLRDTRQTLPLVFGAMRDKNVAGMLEALVPFATTVVCTEARNPRAIPAQELAAIARGVVQPLDVESERDSGRALARAWRRGPRAMVTGSIFLVGELMGRLAATRGA